MQYQLKPHCLTIQHVDILYVIIYFVKIDQHQSQLFAIGVGSQLAGLSGNQGNSELKYHTATTLRGLGG